MNPLPTPHRRLALALYALFTLLSFPQEWPGIGAFDLGLVFAGLGPAALVVGQAIDPARQHVRHRYQEPPDRFRLIVGFDEHDARPMPHVVSKTLHRHL